MVPAHRVPHVFTRLFTRDVRNPGCDMVCHQCDPHLTDHSDVTPDLLRHLFGDMELSVARKRTELDRVRARAAFLGTACLTSYHHETVSACHAHGKEEL